MLAAVMDDMRRPEPSHPVRGAVKPVIGKVIEDKSQRDEPKRAWPFNLDIENSELIDPKAERKYDSAGQDAGHYAAGAQSQGGDRILGLVANLLVLAAPQPFQGHRDDEKRDRPVGRGRETFHDRVYLHEC